MAREIFDKSHIRLTYVTHFYLNQKEACSVTDLLGKYERYSSDLLDLIQFVIVDDGSPLRFEIPEYDLNITWLKINQDIPWNQAGARNLGAVYAKSDKILFSDIDHEFPEETLHHMVHRKECGRNCYKIYRVGKGNNRHPNIFLMSRARFLRLYGYDEEFSGHYGAEDFRFVKFQKYYGTRMMNLSKKYRCIQRNDVDRGISYHSLKRDLTYNSPVDDRKKMEISAYGPDAGHSRMFLNFDWKIQIDRHRNVNLQKTKHPLWKHLWYFRWLFGSK